MQNRLENLKIPRIMVATLCTCKCCCKSENATSQNQLLCQNLKSAIQLWNKNNKESSKVALSFGSWFQIWVQSSKLGKELLKAKNKADMHFMKDLETDQNDVIVEDEDILVYTASVTPQTDDPSTPALTFRSLFIGIIWATFMAILNTLFSFRTVPFVVPAGLAQLLVYPMGIFLAKILPRGILNPGPWTVKEHVLSFVIAASAGGQPYGSDNVVIQYYKDFIADPEVTIWNSLAWVAVSQLVGYGLAGICRRFLVKPSAMFWPSVLPNVALFTALNNVQTNADDSKYPLSRYKFFVIAFFTMFIFQLFPSWFATSLSTISLLCIFTKNDTLRFLGSNSVGSGVGIFAFTFDWTQISITMPISSPFVAAMNFIGGNMFFNWIVIPILYYTRFYGNPTLSLDNPIIRHDNTTVYPLTTSKLFSNNGKQLYIRRVAPGTTNFTLKDSRSVLNHDYSLNITRFNEVKPVYLSESFAVTYLLSFLSISATLSHVGLWYGKEIYRQFKQAMRQLHTSGGARDVHNRLMERYSDVPEAVYLIWLLVFLACSVLVCQFTPFRMPVWATILSFFMGAGFTIPIGIIQAVTGTQIGLNVITEFVIGLLSPGETITMATFKSYGYNIMIQALNLTSDLKLGHYMHISPWSMVTCQMIGTFIGILFNSLSTFYILDSLSSPKVFVDAANWGGNGYAAFLSAAGIWGAIGPARFLGPGTPYFSLLLGFPIGIAIPLIPWLLNKAYPNEFWKLINFPLIFYGVPNYQPFPYLLPAMIISFITQYHIKNNYPEWFTKYNYVLAIAFDSGAAISVFTVTVLKLFWPELEAGPSLLNPITTHTDYYCYGLDYQGK